MVDSSVFRCYEIYGKATLATLYLKMVLPGQRHNVTTVVLIFDVPINIYAGDIRKRPASVAQLDAHTTGDQEVVGLVGSAVFFHGDLIMKYFLWSFSPFC